MFRSDKQIVNINRNAHAESMTSASSFRCVFQAIQHCSSAAHCSAKYASESDSAQGWPYKARFDFRIGSFMSTTQSKWSKDAGKPHQVASPPRGRLRVCWLTSACQRTLCKAHNTTTQQGTRYANQLARHTMQCIHLPNHFPISSFNAISCTTHAALPHCICQIITLQ